MAINNDPNYVKRFTVEYAASGLAKCIDCSKKIKIRELKVAENLMNEQEDKMFPYWHHYDCITFPTDEEFTLDDFSGYLYLTYEDQIRIAQKINLIIDKESDVEKKIKSDCRKFHQIIGELREVKKEIKSDSYGNVMRAFLKANRINIMHCKRYISNLQNLTADCIMYGGFEPCDVENCTGTFIYDHNQYQCRQYVPGVSDVLCMNTKAHINRIPIESNGDFHFEKLLRENDPIIERTVRTEFSHRIVCQPSPAKRPKISDSTEDQEVNQAKPKTIYQDEGGLIYAVLLRRVQLDLHKDSFVMMKLVQLENAKFSVEISKGTFNSKMFSNTLKPDIYDDLTEAIFSFEKKFRTFTNNSFGFEFHKDLFAMFFTMLPVVRRENSDEIQKVLNDHRVVTAADIGVEGGYEIIIDIGKLEELIEKLNNLDEGRENEKRRMQYSNLFYESIPVLNDTGSIQPVLSGNVLEKYARLTDALQDLKLEKENFDGSDSDDTEIYDVQDNDQDVELIE